ncbi:MAG: hypothetical protein ABIK99_07125 [candidate division WOR-3 bacterium]
MKKMAEREMGKRREKPIFFSAPETSFGVLVYWLDFLPQRFLLGGERKRKFIPPRGGNYV